MTEDLWIAAKGELCDDSTSFVSRARELAELLRAGEIPFARLVSLSKTEDTDIVTFEVDVELAQDRIHDIRLQERLSTEFSRDDRWTPEVFALRRCFPFVPHLNLRDTAVPRSLCLFEEPWHETQLWWTPGRFIEVLRNWLAATARDELHADDQPLEPLLLGTSIPLIVPANFGEENGPVRLDVIHVQTPEMKRPVLVARHPEDIEDLGQEHVVHSVATVFVGQAQEHGIIAHTPLTLADLRDLLSAAEIDLVTELTSLLKKWRENKELLDRKPILITVLPKLRKSGGAVEATDIFAFSIDETVATLGENLGLWQMREGHACTLIPQENPTPEEVRLVCLHPVSELSMRIAARAAGRDPDLRKAVAVGQGALGSQVVSNLIRTGFGSWTLIDHDVLLPHNLTRHALLSRSLGFPKAQYMAAALTDTVQDSKVQALVCDVLNPRDKARNLAAALNEAEIVFDFSASTAVARHLADDTFSKARRISAFLSPSGRYLVMLVEDADRAFTIYELEAQFHRLLIRTKDLQEFYQENPASLRYGGSCADISMHIPQDRVALHAAITAGAVQRLTEEGFVSIWRLTDELAVEHHCSPATACQWFEGSDWKIGINSRLKTHLLDLRSSALPCETGGVLVGTVDAHRKSILLVDALPAPPDSEEWPTAFIRGSVGLRKDVEKIEKWTGQAVHYIGEWHSHPSGISLKMSSDDKQVLEFVTKHMRSEGLPGIVLIVGETEIQCHIKAH